LGWFNKLTNPAWDKLTSLKPQESFELSVMILLHGYLRMTLRNEFVSHFEKICDPRVPENILKGAFGSMFKEAQKLWPIRSEFRERLLDEIELGFLSASIGKPIGNLRFEVFNAETMIEGAGCFALAEINNRLGRKEPSVLSKVGYSRDLDECRVQVIISWMRLGSLQEPLFPSMLSNLFFEEKWRSANESFLAGFSTGLGRTDRDASFARVKEECKSLSPLGIAMISSLCEGVVQKRMPLRPR
jgi:hypothetical protein